MKAKKAALLAAAAAEDAPDQDVEDEGEEDSADEQEVVAEETVDEVVEEEATEEAPAEAPAESSDDDLSTIPGVGPATVTKLQDVALPHSLHCLMQELKAYQKSRALAQHWLRKLLLIFLDFSAQIPMSSYHHPSCNIHAPWVIGGTGLVRIEDFEFLSSQGFEVKSDDFISADTEFGNVPLRCISFSKDSSSHELIFLQRHHGQPRQVPHLIT